MSESIFAQISRGDFDAQIDALVMAVSKRQRYLRDQRGIVNQAELLPGTPVVIIGGIRPKYLVGLTGVVSLRPSGRLGDIQVDIDPGQCTGRFSKQIGIPANCLAAR